MKRITKCDITLSIVSILILLIGILGLTIFPSIYQQLVFSNIALTANDYTEKLGISAFLFSKPPMLNEMRFYFFNVTNEDEMIYEGAPVRVVQVGPYTFMESEEKRYLQYRKNDDQVYYQNYKKWIYHNELSCDSCSYNDIVSIPNAPQIGSSAGMYDPLYGVTPTARTIIAIGLLLLGEYPINSPTVGDLLFDGYNDALLSAAHSPIVTILSNMFNEGVNIIPIPVPDMHTMAYFNSYNNSRDEEYWIHTGKEDINRIGEIVTWANQTMLPETWWTTEQARMINGTDTGSFAPPGLNEDSILPMFHSYLCRSFNAVYQGQREVFGIPSYTYAVQDDEWDTTLEKNKGFRYRNVEKIKYYNDWPMCPKWNSSNCKASPNDPIDCYSDLCNDCCNKGQLGDTYAIPPGLFPLACYPGRLQPSPFAVLWSPPHFLYSPDQVINSVKGINPDRSKHQPMVYDHEPYSGMITQVAYRAQIAIPMFANPIVIQNSHLPSSIAPIFYEDSTAILTDFAYSFYRLGFMFFPVFIMWFSISLIIFSVILAILILTLCVKRT